MSEPEPSPAAIPPKRKYRRRKRRKWKRTPEQIAERNRKKRRVPKWRKTPWKHIDGKIYRYPPKMVAWNLTDKCNRDTPEISRVWDLLGCLCNKPSSYLFHFLWDAPRTMREVAHMVKSLGIHRRTLHKNVKVLRSSGALITEWRDGVYYYELTQRWTRVSANRMRYDSDGHYFILCLDKEICSRLPSLY
jgi:hypothetical protein